MILELIVTHEELSHTLLNPCEIGIGPGEPLMNGKPGGVYVNFIRVVWEISDDTSLSCAWWQSKWVRRVSGREPVWQCFDYSPDPMPVAAVAED